MPIIDLVPKDFICLEQQASLQTAAQVMKDHFVSCLVVVPSNGSRKPLGTLTDRDVLLSVVADKVPSSTPVEAVMSKHVMTARKDERISLVFGRMEAQKIRQVVIVDLEGNACGLLTLDDALAFLGRELQGLGSLVERQIENDRIARSQQIQFLL